MLSRHALQALRPAARAGAALLCATACWAHAAELGSPLGGTYNPFSDPWMVGQSRWSLGISAEPRYQPPWSFTPDSRYTSPTNLMVGMNLNSSGNARLVWYTPVAQPRYNSLAIDQLQAGQAVDANGVPLSAQPRVGLVLKPADPLADLRQGALTKLELSGNMALSLRPKAGGVFVALSGRW